MVGFQSFKLNKNQANSQGAKKLEATDHYFRRDLVHNH